MLTSEMRVPTQAPVRCCPGIPSPKPAFDCGSDIGGINFLNQVKRPDRSLEAKLALANQARQKTLELRSKSRHPGMNLVQQIVYSDSMVRAVDKAPFIAPAVSGILWSGVAAHALPSIVKDFVQTRLTANQEKKKDDGKTPSGKPIAEVSFGSDGSTKVTVRDDNDNEYHLDC